MTNYHGPERREHNCPVENCGEVQELIEKNKVLSKRITQLGLTSIGILGIIVTVLLAMSNRTMDMAINSSHQLGDFIEKHNEVMIRDENIHATLVNQMVETQRRLDTTSDIQREIIQEVAILKKGRVR